MLYQGSFILIHETELSNRSRRILGGSCFDETVSLITVHGTYATNRVKVRMHS